MKAAEERNTSISDYLKACVNEKIDSIKKESSVTKQIWEITVGW